MSRRILLAITAVAVAAVVAIGLSQASSGGSGEKPLLTREELQKRLAGAPPALAALHRQGGQLLDATPRTVRARLRGLRGHPVVVNKWASWCGPCRLEFPVFQRVSAELGRQVAFVGLDGKDNLGDARRFLAEIPLSYPSFQDPDERIARALQAGTYYPTTVFIGADGKVKYVHQGGYVDDAKLLADVRRYAMGSL